MDGRPRTLFEKIWDAHVVAQLPDGPTVLYIDLHLVHEVTSPQAFEGLRKRGLKVRRPDRTFATLDHGIPNPRPQLADHGRVGADKQGIVHVIGPELGLTQPGMTIVCGDSHTSHPRRVRRAGFGIGTSEVEMVLATQCLLQRKPKTMNDHGRRERCARRDRQGHHPRPHRQIRRGRRHGLRVRVHRRGHPPLSMEGRMTICNMSIEGGSRAGLIAPDDTTFEWLAGREYAPKGAAWDARPGVLAQPAHRRRRATTQRSASTPAASNR
jgi:3-isopropylmalate/(R)-2-methylmalate dehydratase large subunit